MGVNRCRCIGQVTKHGTNMPPSPLEAAQGTQVPHPVQDSTHENRTASEEKSFMPRKKREAPPRSTWRLPPTCLSLPAVITSSKFPQSCVCQLQFSQDLRMPGPGGGGWVHSASHNLQSLHLTGTHTCLCEIFLSVPALNGVISQLRA